VSFAAKVAIGRDRDNRVDENRVKLPALLPATWLLVVLDGRMREKIEKSENVVLLWRSLKTTVEMGSLVTVQMRSESEVAARYERLLRLMGLVEKDERREI